MALTALQSANTRRWMGYPTLNSGEADYVYGHTPSSISLTAKLAELTATDEGILTTTYLANLATLEQGILDSADNMDTAKAGPWEANPREVDERKQLFNEWRRGLCAFLGFAPGPSLSGGGNSIPILRS